MSVFGGQSQTEIATGLQNPDYSLTTNWGPNAKPPDKQIATDTWLPGTTGVDCKLVHGDRWQEIKGKMSQNIDDVTTSNYGVRSGDNALSENYHASVVREMHGASFAETYYAGTNSRDYTGHLYEHYHAGHAQHNDVEEVEVRWQKFEAVITMAFDFALSGIKIGGSELSFAGVGICFSGLEVGVAGDRKEYGGESQKMDAFKQEITLAMKEEIALVKSEIRPLRNGLAFLTYNTHVLDLRMGELLATGFVAPG